MKWAYLTIGQFALLLSTTLYAQDLKVIDRAGLVRALAHFDAPAQVVLQSETEIPSPVLTQVDGIVPPIVGVASNATTHTFSGVAAGTWRIEAEPEKIREVTVRQAPIAP